MDNSITRDECLDKMIAAIEAADHDQETKDYLTYVILAQFDGQRQLDAILNNSNDKEFTLDRINAVAEKLHGPGFQLTAHGFSQAVSDRYVNKEQSIVKHLQIFNAFLYKNFNITAFITAGTLLGMIREGIFLGHDDDIDLAYVSQYTDPKDILKERQALFDLVSEQDNMSVLNSNGVLVIKYSFEDTDIYFDLLTGYCEGDYINIYMIKPNSIPKESILPLKTGKFYGEDINIPQIPETLLDVSYGPNWRTPDRSFRFNVNEHIPYYKFLLEEINKNIQMESNDG